MSREYLKRVWEDTVNHGALMEPPKSIKYSLIQEPDRTQYYYTKIVVENQDTFNMAEDFLAEGLNPVALNMACNTGPGGGVAHGARAQEECLFRRSDYFRTLTQGFYPLRGSEVVYSPRVTVFKDYEYKLQTPFQIACIACPAINRPRLSPDGFYNTTQYETMHLKIENIFRVALHHGHDSMVLGALGCGAYGNPPTQVIDIFNQMLEKYDGCFEKIGFAVMSDRDNNYELFSKRIR